MKFPKVVKRMRTKKQADAAKDIAENAAVRGRSGGQCEVREIVRDSIVPYRCTERATQVHHMIGGRGRRGVGISALKEHKQAVCDSCHLDITGDIGGKRLKRIGDVLPHWTDYYERVK